MDMKHLICLLPAFQFTRHKLPPQNSYLAFQFYVSLHTFDSRQVKKFQRHTLTLTPSFAVVQRKAARRKITSLQGCQCSGASHVKCVSASNEDESRSDHAHQVEGNSQTDGSSAAVSSPERGLDTPAGFRTCLCCCEGERWVIESHGAPE